MVNIWWTIVFFCLIYSDDPDCLDVFRWSSWLMCFNTIDVPSKKLRWNVVARHDYQEAMENLLEHVFRNVLGVEQEDGSTGCLCRSHWFKNHANLVIGICFFNWSVFFQHISSWFHWGSWCFMILRMLMSPQKSPPASHSKVAGLALPHRRYHAFGPRRVPHIAAACHGSKQFCKFKTLYFVTVQTRMVLGFQSCCFWFCCIRMLTVNIC